MNATGTGVQRVREALAEHDCRPRGSNLKLRACCPVHGSRGPTLAVSQGHSGAVVKCHAQCETGDVIAAIGLSWCDLYDESQERAVRPWKPARTEPSAAEQVGRKLVRAVEIMLTAEAMERSAVLRPRLTPDERVEHAEWACEVEASRHFWRTRAKWSALACDEDFVRQAYRDREAWLEHRGPKPTHEQEMVLMFRAEDLARERAS